MPLIYDRHYEDDPQFGITTYVVCDAPRPDLECCCAEHGMNCCAKHNPSEER